MQDRLLNLHSLLLYRLNLHVIITEGFTAEELAACLPSFRFASMSNFHASTIKISLNAQKYLHYKSIVKRPTATCPELDHCFSFYHLELTQPQTALAMVNAAALYCYCLMTRLPIAHPFLPSLVLLSSL